MKVFKGGMRLVAWLLDADKRGVNRWWLPLKAKKAQKRRHARTMARRRTRPSKGQATFRKQCRAMAYNMSTRAGFMDGLRWREMRDTVAAQKGLTTRQLEVLRRTWCALERDPARKPWPQFLEANRV